MTSSAAGWLADLHIHSHFSRATSRDLAPAGLEAWARRKGLRLLGTGDCLHPGWLAELKRNLEPDANGFLRRRGLREQLPRSLAAPPFAFIPTGEVSTIYRRDSRTRKIHHLCVFPDLAAAERAQARLRRLGNIEADGRPILGLDSRDLLEIVLEASPEALLIPAHIWTPWFALLGSQSGFDSLDECFGDLASHVTAVETGLSADPPMLWACRFLDRLQIISSSDAHSLAKLGREATRFTCDLSWPALRRALTTGEGLAGTVEFFPEEGKYHFDGHRQCRVRWDPLATLAHEGRCPVCGKPVTVGVMHRVAMLADREDPASRPDRKPFQSVAPLAELLGEIFEVGAGSRRVENEYHRLLGSLGAELDILLTIDPGIIERQGGELLAEGVRRLRAGQVRREPGYDGEFGRIRVFAPEERQAESGSLFALAAAAPPPPAATGSITFDIAEFQRRLKVTGGARLAPTTPPPPAGAGDAASLSPAQREAVEHADGSCVVIAGPGSGKTRVLVERVIHLVKRRKTPPARILVLAFSVNAAEEMKRRLAELLPRPCRRLTTLTLHALGLEIIRSSPRRWRRSPEFRLLDDEEREELLLPLAGGKRRVAVRLREALSRAKTLGEPHPQLDEYDELLRQADAFDLDDLILRPVEFLRADAAGRRRWQKHWSRILVDEFQDLSALQYELLRLIAGPTTTLFAIGDPAQSIYGFRGADASLMAKLPEDWPGLAVRRLDRSFRCGKIVLAAAGRVLAAPPQAPLPGRGGAAATPGAAPEIPAAEAAGLRIHVQRCATEKEEADWIAGRIEAMLGGTRSFARDSGMTDGRAEAGFDSPGRFAVLCRAASLFPPLVRAFHDHGLPFQVAGEAPFFRSEPFRPLFAAFRNAVHGTPGAVDPLRRLAARLVKRRTDIEAVFDELAAAAGLAEGEREQCRRLTHESGRDYHGFLRRLATWRGADDFERRAELVSLMTLHAAKGLEFAAVFIAGCEEGLIPWTLYHRPSAAELEEERRLMYVGMTRAEKRLFLSHARQRRLRGRRLELAPSSFLRPLTAELIDEAKRAPRPDRDDRQLELFSGVDRKT